MTQSSPRDPQNMDIVTLAESDIPPRLKEISDPPKALSLRGTLPPEGHVMLAVVGARKHTAYGKEVTNSLIRGLRGYPITIVSGLALGIDALAHEASLEVGLPTLAVPGSGLDWDVLYPRQHERLAHKILEAGGGLL